MIVVGLTGKAGSGKTEVANYLVEKHGFTKLSFATPLKKMLRTLDPIMGSQLVFRDGMAQPIRLSDVFRSHAGNEGVLKAGYFGPEYRRLMQVLATDCIRAMDEDFWVRAAMQQLTDPIGRYVFDDVRFPNERAALRALRFKGHTDLTAWVVRDKADLTTEARTWDTHESESWPGKLGEDFFLKNFESIERLHSRIDGMLDMSVGVPA